jgi:hypothetical protein
VRWRLRRRPYVALVFAERSFDALVWVQGNDPEPLEALQITGAGLLHPTNRTYERLHRAR